MKYVYSREKAIVISQRANRGLDKAALYIAKDSLKQAEIMKEQFYEVVEKIKRMPTRGTQYVDDIRRMKLGKFAYHVYYREKRGVIEILGIRHTRRSGLFSPPKSQK